MILKSVNEILEDSRVKPIQIGSDGGQAFIKLPRTGSKAPLMCVFSIGCDWDHVSVSLKHRCPTWEEMCTVKDIFFHEDEVAVQYHPAKKDYVNNHPYCLHIWRPQLEKMPLPPSVLVGV